MEEAVERARSGRGATLIECKTYRTRAHAEGMGDYTYRTREDVAEWRQRCPIRRLATRLIEDGIASQQDLAAIESEIKAQVADAGKSAEDADWPDPATASTHVYFEGSEPALPALPAPGDRPP